MTTNAVSMEPVKGVVACLQGHKTTIEGKTNAQREQKTFKVMSAALIEVTSDC